MKPSELFATHCLQLPEDYGQPDGGLLKEVADILRHRSPGTSRIYAKLGLIASTGLRLSEAVHLLDVDVDWALGLLTVRQTKFNKSRQLPLHPGTVAALSAYRQLRGQFVQDSPDAPFFVGTRGKRQGKMLGAHQVERVFGGLRGQLGWVNRGARDAPRIHDLRHTFVVCRVLLWQS